MARVTRMLMALLRRCAWLLRPERDEWLEGLLAEAADTPAGPTRVAWLLGGVWLIVAEVLRAGAVRMLAFVAAAGVALGIAWPGSSSDSAVLVNRIEVPVALGLLALAPLLVRRFFGPVRDGRLPRAVRVGGYLVVLALLTATAVEAREGQKLGAYFADGGTVAGLVVLVIAGYTTVLLILTSQRVRVASSALAITMAAGTITGVGLYALYGFELHSPPLGGWIFTALALPLLTGLAVTRLAAGAAPSRRLAPGQQRVVVAVCAPAILVALLGLLTGSSAPWLLLLLLLGPVLIAGVPIAFLKARDSPPRDMTPAGQGGLLAVCATGTAVLLLAALTTVTIAVAPRRVPLQTPGPPTNGGCETCDPNGLVIPPRLRHEYWVGLSIAQENLPFYLALGLAPMFALFAGGLGVGIGEASRRVGSHGSDPSSSPALAAAAEPG